MSETSRNLDVVPVEGELFIIKNFDESLKKIEDFISTHSQHVAVYSKLDAKLCKAERTEIRAMKDEIADIRKSVNDNVLGEFNEHCKTLEDMLKQADEEHKASLDAFNGTLTKITLTITSYDLKAINQLKELALTMNCKATIK